MRPAYEFAASDSFILVFLIVYLAFFAIMLLGSIALYVIRSLSVYTIARRRGIEHPWLSWLPVGHEWILGSLSDQYKYLVQGKFQSRRKILLGLSVANMIAYLLGMGVMLITVIVAAMEESVPIGVVFAVLLWLVCFGCGIATVVFSFMCKYDIYKSCDPKNAVAFLIFSIFIGVTEPFFLLACRNKDLGMPPRKDAQEPAAPQYQPEPPAAEAAEALNPAEEAVEEAGEEAPAEEETIEVPAAPILLDAPESDAPTMEPDEEIPAEE